MQGGKSMKKKYKKVIVLLVIVVQLLIVTGCSNGGRLEEAAKKAEKVETEQKSQEYSYEKQVEKWESHYELYERTVEESVAEMEKEGVVTNSTDVVVKESYEDPNELATYTSKVLFDFYKGVVKPEQYLAFINKYGSKEMRKNVMTGEPEEDLDLVNAIQEAIVPQAINYASYEISKVELNEKETEAIFYRKIQLGNGTLIFFQTLLRKENGVWLYETDEPNVPVDFVAK